ncbi:MAG: transporter substrate-binding domain-containing protein [Desulfobacterales bacterium]|nr:transporter substrate-binding domain-containing protein [Desulfobacterales bacterium]
MERKIQYVIVSLLCSFFFTPAVLADDRLNAPLLIRVGAYENKPKIFTDESGNVVGLFADILNHISKEEGWQLEYVHGSWSQCLKRLEENEIDLMVDVAYSEKRAQKYHFTNVTVLINWAIVYAGTNQKIESLIDLNGKRIAVMKASIHTEGVEGIKSLAKNFDINCRFVEVESYQEVFERISRGEVEAGVVNRIYGSLFSQAYNVRETSIIFNPRHLRFALPKSAALSPLLSKRLDHHLSELKKEPASIYNKALYIYLSGLPRELIYSEPETERAGKRVILSSEEAAWIRDHPVIRIGVDPEFAPFEYITSDGSYDGIASDYIAILNERLGLHMQLAVTRGWKDAVSKAKTREIDVLPCVGITRQRTGFLKFSKPYINFYRVIITRTDNPFLTGLEDLENMNVAVQADTSHEGYLQDNTNIAPLLYDTLQEGLLALSNEQADAFVGNLTSSTYWIRKLNLTNLKVAAPVSQETQNLHFAVRDDWPVLVGILNKGLSSISEQEEIEIRKKWINIEYKPGISRRAFWRYTFQIGGVVLVVFAVIMFWNYRLKHEIHKRIQIEKELFEANQNLRALDRLKSMFIASMSHELRTPLNSIIGFTGVILQGMTGPLNDKQHDHLSRVYNSAKHLLNLITDVIDISKIEAGRIEIFRQEVNLAELVDEAVITIQPQLRDKKLTLQTSVSGELVMHTDKKRLLQCIINYLSNAVKYTESGTIAITARQIDDRVEILVSDTGIGISQEDQTRLFDAFERLDSHLRVKEGGTGLGLYLTRKLATEILGGEVLVRSREGRGSTFGLLLPIGADTAASH